MRDELSITSSKVEAKFADMKLSTIPKMQRIELEREMDAFQVKWQYSSALRARQIGKKL